MQEKPIGDFYKHTKHRLQTQCKVCQNARAKETHASNKEVNNARMRNNHLKRKYGITSADYEVMLASQEGRCWICKRFPKTGGKRLCVDHCHKTGKVRGLLCYNCNYRLLPAGRENADTFQRAAEYIKTRN